MSDEVKAVLLYLFGLAVIVVACLGITYCGTWYECDSKATEQGLEHQWGPFKGCLIKVDGKWVDYDKWRVME